MLDDVNPQQERWSGNVSMALASAIVMLLEITLFHVLIYISNYIEANAIISMALLGIALGGGAGYLLYRREARSLCALAGPLTGVAILMCIANLILFPSLLAYSVVLILPFLGASTVVAYLFARMNEHRAYFWNLLGAAAGVLAACALVPFIMSENVLLLCICLSGALGLVLSIPQPRRRTVLGVSILVMCAGIAATLGNLATGTLDFAQDTRPQKDQSLKVFDALARQSGARIAYARDSLVARVDILKGPNSPNFQTYQEGVVSDHVLSLPPSAYAWDVRIPNASVTPDPSILVIGTSAEGVTKTARHLSKDNTVGVEINPAIVDLMQNELFEASARAYENVEMHVTDARTYLEGASRQFDMITLMNTHTRGRTSENAGLPQYLFTVEAMDLMLDRLTDRGALLFEEIRVGDLSDFFIRRIFANVIEGLKCNGVSASFESHFYAYTYRVGAWKYIIFMVRKNPFTPEDVHRMDEWFRVKKEKYCRQVKELTMVIHPTTPIETPFAEFVRNPDQETNRILQENRLDLSATTDDRPFLFDLDVSYPEQWRIFIASLVATFVLVLAPCAFVLFRSYRNKLRASVLQLAYFSLLGMAYMLVEVALMQQYQLLLGSPVHALVIVLASILLFSGLGSLFSGKLSVRGKKALVGVVPLLLLAAVFLLPYFFAHSQSFPFAMKVLAALGTLFPLFFCMGVPFPCGLAVVRTQVAAGFMPIAYGVNGAFATIGVTAGLLLSVYIGFSITLYLGIALYTAAFLLLGIMMGKVSA